MKEFYGSASAHTEASARDVFDLVVDVDRLPEWNRAIEEVVERPGELTEGATWTVRMHPPRLPRWGSVSRVETLDRDRLQFAYETRNADGNPSFVKWSWHVAEQNGGSDVTVTWECHLETLDRRLLAGPLRRRGLAREVPKSLTALAEVVRVA